MKASLRNPIYTTYVLSGDQKYNISPAVESLDFSDQEKQISHSVRITLLNAKMGSGWLSDILSIRNRVIIYANDGAKNDEVWRGFIWSRPREYGLTERTISLKCYDNLIYFQESEDAEFFASGKSTKTIMSTFCDKWGVKLSYSYESITHSKLALRGNLADIFTADVLDLVKKRTGKKYVIRSEKDVMYVMTVGQNATVYDIKKKENAITAKGEETMDGMTTKIVIYGKANDDDRRPIEATISGNTSQYGTLQKIVNREENTSLADAKKEAQSVIDEDGKPKEEYSVVAIDIPWIRKGDKVNLDVGDLKGAFIVLGIDREISNDAKKMTLTLEKA